MVVTYQQDKKAIYIAATLLGETQGKVSGAAEFICGGCKSTIFERI